MARLIRTEKEVEGRYEEVWLVVEEDALEQWPAGPREVVGRPATRVDGLERARGEAVYTADVKLPGCSTPPCCAARMRTRVSRASTSRRRSRSPGVHAAIGPREIRSSKRSAAIEGAAVAAVCADTYEQARAAVAAIEVEWELLEAVLDPDEAVARGQLNGEPRERERGDFERGLAEADAVVEGEYRTQVVLHNSMETHQAVVQWLGDTLEVYISTQYIWGVREEVAASARPARRQGARHLRLHGRRLRLEEQRGRLHLHRDRAREAHEPSGALRTDAARGEPRAGQPQRDDPAADDRRGRDGTLTALGGEYVNATGWGGWSSPVEGPMQLLYACPNVKTTTSGAKINQPPMKAFRAPGFVEGTFGLESLIDELAAKLGLDPLELRRRNYADHDAERRAAVQRQEPDRVLPPRRAALGAPARGARALDGHRQARRRHGVADLVRRRRPAELRVDPRRLRRPRHRRDRDAGHRHRHEDGDGADRGGGARHPARARHRLARRLGARAVRGDLRRLVDDAVDGPGRARRGGGREAADRRDRRAALRPRAVSTSGGMRLGRRN